MRIKFYGKNDLSSGDNLKKSEEKMIKGININDINDIIELHNIQQFFKNGMYLKTWNEEKVNNLKAQSKEFTSIIAKCINNIDTINYIEEFKKIDREYKNDFLFLTQQFKIYEKINPIDIKKLINSKDLYLFDILQHKNLVLHFQDILKNIFLNDSQSAEILIDKFCFGNKNSNLYIPSNLEKEDEELIIKNYIESDKPNLNYIRAILSIKDSKEELFISPKVRLLAQKEEEKQNNEILNGKNSSSLEFSITVKFVDSLKTERKISYNPKKIEALYSKKWIEENLDFPTLLNNFIYLFDFVDNQMRSLHVNRKFYSGIMEKLIQGNLKNGYQGGFAFQNSEMLSLLQIRSYYKFLLDKNIRLESIIEWFFGEYLKKEFNIENFSVQLPSEKSEYFEKCHSIISSTETALNIFTLYAEEKNIDTELLELKSLPVYSDIPSLIEKKYIYGKSEIFYRVADNFFSDQTTLGYNENFTNKYNTLFEFLYKEKVLISHFEKYNRPIIDKLLEEKYLIKKKNGRIFFNDLEQIVIFKDLYENEVISYMHYSISYREKIDKMVDLDLLKYESSLFSKQEVQYINYLFNNREFTDGLNLRNKYAHTQPTSDVYSDYLIFLKVFVLIVIKINDEFCLLEKLKNN